MTNSLSSRALPIAVVGFSLIFFWAWVWFAFAGGGNLTDPADILTQGAQATADANSFSFDLSVEGSMTDADNGAPIELDGVTVAGEVDSGAEAAHVTFSLPMLFGMSGEVIVIGQDLYVLTAMAGDDWLHLAEEPAIDGESEETPPTDEEIAAKIDELLATDGVSLTKLADQPCGEDTCYHVQLSISAEAMAAHDGEMPDPTDLGEMGELGGLLPNPDLSGPAVVDLLFQQDGLWLREVTVATASDSGDARFVLSMADFNTSFDISAPPPDQVIEAEDFPLFQ